MRIRHLVLIALAIAAAATAVQSAAPDRSSQPAGLEDGSISVVATRAGVGAWVPYTITIRNLGDRAELAGRVLLVKRAPAQPSPPRLFTPFRGGPAVVLPWATGGTAGTGPDAAYEFPIRLNSRHKRTLTFFAPSDYSVVAVQDSAGRLVSESTVDDRASLAIGLLSDSQTLAQALQPVVVGDLHLRVQEWTERSPFPTRAVDLSGLSAILLAHYDTGRLSALQIEVLREYVALGGELVMAGGADLSRTVGKLPDELLAFRPSGETAMASLEALGELSGTALTAAGAVAGGAALSGATVFLETAEGRPLGVEARYGAGRVVELLFDPEPRGAASFAPAGLSSIAFSAAILRGLDHFNSSPARGRMLTDATRLSESLFPTPADAPFPPLWPVATVMVAYLVIVLPGTYLLLRRLHAAAFLWLTAPVLAVALTAALYLAGQTLQSTVRDQDLQLLRLGPGGALSSMELHGLTFPGRGEHRIEFGSGSTAEPLTVSYPGLTPACERCPFPVEGGGGGLEEHVLSGSDPVVRERGIIYGSVRIVGAATAGRADLRLQAALDSNQGRISGTISNLGRIKVRALFVYTRYRGAYRVGVVAPGLDPGQAVTFSTEVSPIRDQVGNLPAGLRLSSTELAGLFVDELGRRNLDHPGQVVVVGFVAPVVSGLRVDGAAPRRRVLTAFALPAELRQASGLLGDFSAVRLTAALPAPDGGLVSTYDIAIPRVVDPILLTFDERLYADIEIYDWEARRWHSPAIEQAPGLSLAGQTPVPASAIRNGLVRVRAHEHSLNWGSDLSLRFAGEAP